MLKLGFGMMRLPLQEPDKPALIDMDQVEQMVDDYLAGGGDYFDTAYMYHDGNSERAVHDAVVARHPRSSYRLATKLPLGFFETREDMIRVFEGQFEKCGVDYFDMYLVHNVNGSNYDNAQQLGAFEYLQEQKEAGRIRRLGFSYHDDADFLERVVLKEHPESEFVQLQINYLDWDSPAIQSRRCVEVVRKAGKEIIVMEPQRGGLLANPDDKVRAVLSEASPALTPAQLAFRFVAQLEGVTTILSGMSSTQQMQENLETFRNLEPLTHQEMDALQQAVAAFRAQESIPCTACNYCEGCPVDIPIPRYFALYNAFSENESGFSAQRMYYENAQAQGYAPASNCIKCRRCEQHCPQHIVISDEMTAVAERFEKRG